ncbi:hypothetical protein [Symmachiella dynata]|uniref:hypothetical protein n=1 Tax=Symmachiella dynata TaxID=2527995 RepID=UPI0030EC38FB
MTLLELQPKLRQAVAQGQIGSPVALRVYLKSSHTDADLQSGCITAMGMARELFDSPPARLMVRGDLQRQATVLVTCTSGATLFATLEGGTVKSSSIQLTLVGNHGIANLESASWTPAEPPEESPESTRWRQALSESHATGKAVAIS